MNDLFFVVGEPSGDLHAKNLACALKKLNPNYQLAGISGPQLRKIEFDSFMDIEEFHVMGFSEVIRSLPKLAKNFYKIRDHLLKIQPKVVVFIDYPDFNLRLAKSLRQNGFKNKLIHYIAPSVWAWRKKRTQQMAKSLDLLLTIYPFEPAYFAHTSLPTEYVGNPVVSEAFEHSFDPLWRNSYGLNPQEKLVALFPGSRPQEIERNLPLHLEAAFKIKEQFPNLKFAVSCASSGLSSQLEETISKGPLKNDIVIIPEKHRYELMNEAACAIAKSGTVTLELALRGCPTVVTYELNFFNYVVAKYLLRIDLPHYCIANILLGETLFPEMIGYKLDANQLKFHLSQLLAKEQSAYTKKAAERLRALLTREDANLKAAQAIGKLCS